MFDELVQEFGIPVPAQFRFNFVQHIKATSGITNVEQNLPVIPPKCGVCGDKADEHFHYGATSCLRKVFDIGRYVRSMILICGNEKNVYSLSCVRRMI